MPDPDHLFPLFEARDPAAEQALLGHLLSGEDVWAAAASLEAAAFYSPAHRLIWQTALDLHRAGRPGDLSSLAAELNRQGRLAQAGGGRYLQVLRETCPEEGSPAHYAGLLALYARRREVMSLGMWIYRLGLAHPNPLTFPRAKIEAALAAVDPGPAGPPNIPAPPPPTAFSAADLLARPPEPTPWLVEGLLIAGGVNLLAGEVASGKTFLALDLALAAAAGAPVWDGRPCRSGPVRYYCLDSAPRAIQERLRSLCAARGLSAPPGLVFDFGPLNLALPADLARLEGALRCQPAGPVIFDVLARYMPGVDENSVASIGPLMTQLRLLASSSGCSILLLHHFNKGGFAAGPAGLRVRGSTDIFGAVDAALTVTSAPRHPAPAGADDPGPQPVRRLLTPEKNREAPEERRMEFEIVSEGAGMRLAFREAQGRETRQEQGLEALTAALREAGQELTRRELEERVGELNQDLNRLFRRLGQVEGVRVGRRGHELTYRMEE